MTKNLSGFCKALANNIFLTPVSFCYNAWRLYSIKVFLAFAKKSLTLSEHFSSLAEAIRPAANLIHPFHSPNTTGGG
jgi:hypothetical protein